MKFPIFLLTALMLVGQLPAIAIDTVLQPVSSVRMLDLAEQSSVYGGICTTCEDEDGDDSDPVPVGQPYWDSGGSRLIRLTRPAYQVIWGYSNFSSSTPVTLTHSYSTTSSLSWSISGGLPAGIVSAQIGQQGSSTETKTISATVAPRTRFDLLGRTTREQREYSYTQYQDYSDGSRSARSSASVRTNRTYTENSSRTQKL